MIKNNLNIREKLCFINLSLVVIAMHYFLSNILLYGIYNFFINILHITEKHFITFSNWAEIFINIILIFIFLTIHCLIFKKRDTQHLWNKKYNLFLKNSNESYRRSRGFWSIISLDYDRQKHPPTSTKSYYNGGSKQLY